MTVAPFSRGDYDAVIIGGGFYGCSIAAYLVRERGFRRVILVERETGLLSRASYNNQARVHCGYHYPRSFTTAYRSRVNLPQFMREWPSAVTQRFTNLYAIARRQSLVNARQFQRFCKDIGAPLEPVDASLRQMFAPHLIEDIFLAPEYVFDATHLMQDAAYELADCGVEVRLQTNVDRVRTLDNRHLGVDLVTEGARRTLVSSRYVFNCTYSGLNQFKGDFPGTTTQLKHEISEMALMQMPTLLEGLGITVMDGPFFSLMPFPARRLHTLSHVRYTPHLHWLDDADVNPYLKLEMYPKDSRANRMLRDVTRYLPAMHEARHVDSLFEVKTVLVKNEANDGRPILFERHAEMPGCYSILGGKIDNIYDVLEKLSETAFDVDHQSYPKRERV